MNLPLKWSSITSFTFILGTSLFIISSSYQLDQVHSVNNVGPLPQPADRIKNEPESVWVEFIQLALDNKPLNLGQGFPDFAAPEYLIASLKNVSTENVLNHQYTRSFGHPKLIRSLRKYYSEYRNFSKLVDERDQLLITVGAYEALFVSLMAFVQPGDQVILIDPAFDAYAPIVAMAGGRSVYVALKPTTNGISRDDSNVTTESYKLDFNELERKIKQSRTSVLVLNTPNNPLGKIYNRQELEQIADLCKKYNILVIADEVYEQFYYDTNEHLSIAHLPDMWERSITIGSAGKTFSVTGWKIGWAFGPKHLLRYIQLVHQTAVYTVATPLQEALARMLEHEMELISRSHARRGTGELNGPNPTELYWTQLRSDLVAKRNRMASVLARAGIRPIIPQGGYFMVADVSPLASRFPEYKTLGQSIASASINSNDYKFARWLSRVKKLQGIPGSAFYSAENKQLAENLIRFCFIKRDDTLDKFEALINELVKIQ